MSESIPFEIIIKSVLDATGFEGSQVELDAITAKTRQLVAANTELAASGAAGSAVVGEKVLLTATQANAIETQSLAILETKKELQAAIIAGDEVRVSTLRAEVAIRSLTLAQLKEEELSLAELNELGEQETVLLNASATAIEARIAARKLELETMAAQEELNADLIAQEEARLALEEESAAASNARGPLGARGIRGMVGAAGEELGLGSLGFQLMGLAFIVEMVVRAFEHWGDAAKKTREEQEKLNHETEKEQDHIDKISTIIGLENERANVIEKINDLTVERSSASGDEFDKLNAQVEAQQQILGQLDAMGPAVAARQAADEADKKALNQQLEALKSITEEIGKASKQVQGQLELREKIEEIQQGAEIAGINHLEREGQITHAEAERRRANAQAAAEQKKFNDENAASHKIITDTKATFEKAGDEADSTRQTAADAHAKKTAADDAAKKNQDIIERGKNAEADLQKAQHDLSIWELDKFNASVAFNPAEVLSHKESLEAKIASIQLSGAIDDGQGAQQRQKRLDDAAADAAKDAADAKTAADAAQANFVTVGKQAGDTAADQNKAISDRTAVHQATVQAQQTETGYKVQEEGKRDVEERKRKEKEQEKQDREGEKIDGPLRQRGVAVAGEVKSAATGNFSADKEARDIADQLAKNPLDQELANHLRDLTQQLMGHVGQLNQMQAANTKKAFQDAKRYADQLAQKVKNQVFPGSH